MQSTFGIPHARPLPVWVGFALCGLLLVLETFDAARNDLGTHWYFFVVEIIAAIYYLMCLYRFHRIAIPTSQHNNWRPALINCRTDVYLWSG